MSIRTDIAAFGGGVLLRDPRTGRFTGATRGLTTPAIRRATRACRLASVVVPTPGCVVRAAPGTVHIRGMDERAAPGAYAGATVRCGGYPTKLGRLVYRAGRDVWYAA